MGGSGGGGEGGLNRDQCLTKLRPPIKCAKEYDNVGLHLTWCIFYLRYSDNLAYHWIKTQFRQLEQSRGVFSWGLLACLRFPRTHFWLHWIIYCNAFHLFIGLDFFISQIQTGECWMRSSIATSVLCRFAVLSTHPQIAFNLTNTTEARPASEKSNWSIKIVSITSDDLKTDADNYIPRSFKMSLFLFGIFLRQKHMLEKCQNWIFSVPQNFAEQ